MNERPAATEERDRTDFRAGGRHAAAAAATSSIGVRTNVVHRFGSVPVRFHDSSDSNFLLDPRENRAERTTERVQTAECGRTDRQDSTSGRVGLGWALGRLPCQPLVTATPVTVTCSGCCRTKVGVFVRRSGRRAKDGDGPNDS